MILKVDFELNLSNYTAWKCFFLSQMSKKCLKNVSTILHTQFNYNTLLVSPLKKPEFSKSERNSLYLKEQERQTTFWKWQDFCDYFHWNFTSKMMLTNKCSKIYQKTRRPFSQSCLV